MPIKPASSNIYDEMPLGGSKPSVFDEKPLGSKGAYNLDNLDPMAEPPQSDAVMGLDA